LPSSSASSPDDEPLSVDEESDGDEQGDQLYLPTWAADIRSRAPGLSSSSRTGGVPTSTIRSSAASLALRAEQDAELESRPLHAEDTPEDELRHSSTARQQQVNTIFMPPYPLFPQNRHKMDPPLWRAPRRDQVRPRRVGDGSSASLSSASLSSASLSSASTSLASLSLASLASPSDSVSEALSPDEEDEVDEDEYEGLGTDSELEAALDVDFGEQELEPVGDELEEAAS